MKRIAIAAAAVVALAGCTRTAVIVGGPSKPSVTVEAPSITYSYSEVWRMAVKALGEVCAGFTKRERELLTEADIQEAIKNMEPRLFSFGLVEDVAKDTKQAFDEFTALRESVEGYFGKTTVTLAVKCD